MTTELVKIDFHGDDIVAFKDEVTETVYVNIRGICESLGLSFPAQYRKLIADPIYNEGIGRCDIATSFGIKESLFLDGELLHGWLFSIQTNRLKPEIREKHILYKKECFRVLNEYFTKGFALHEAAAERLSDEMLDKLSAKVYERLAPRLSKKPPTMVAESLSPSIEEGILEAVAEGEKSMTELHRAFRNNLDAARLTRALANLQQAGQIEIQKRKARGRCGKPRIIVNMFR